MRYLLDVIYITSDIACQCGDQLTMIVTDGNLLCENLCKKHQTLIRKFPLAVAGYNTSAREMINLVKVSVEAGGEQHGAIRDFLRLQELQRALDGLEAGEQDRRQQLNAEIGTHNAFMYQAEKHPQYRTSLFDIQGKWDELTRAASAVPEANGRADKQADVWIVGATSLINAESVVSSAYFRQSSASSSV